MAKTDFNGTAYVKGIVSGTLIASDQELSFWGGVDSQTGEIIDRHHALSGTQLQGKILAIPGGRGSCSGSGVVLELLLNGNGPCALLFERREDILTLGVMVAEEMFGRAIPVVTLDSGDFKKLLLLDGHNIHVAGCRISSKPVTQTNSDIAKPSPNIALSPVDEALLQGKHGEAARASIRIVLRMAELLDADGLMDVSQVHVDCCIYTGPSSLNFAQRLRDLGGQVRVPTTLNSISIDMQRWRAHGIDPTFGEAAAKLAQAYTDMGASPTFTCAPYQLESAPKLGDQVAWAESNAVVYANSVLGARTIKYPDLLDISIALTGRAPRAGLHIITNRLASLIIHIEEAALYGHTMDDSFYPLLGYCVGSISLSQIPVVSGIQSLAPTKDNLKAFGAAFATTSSSPMFHILGVTPEAPTLEAVTDMTQSIRSVELRFEDLSSVWNKLNSATDGMPVDLISLGNPHFSFSEIRQLAALCRGRIKKGSVAVIVTCNRSTHGLAAQAGLVQELETFGVRFMTDTCWCMLGEPIVSPSTVVSVMTNSAKYAHYGPGLTDRKFYFGSLARCVDAACDGLSSSAAPEWLRGSPPHAGG